MKDFESPGGVNRVVDVPLPCLDLEGPLPLQKQLVVIGWEENQDFVAGLELAVLRLSVVNFCLTGTRLLQFLVGQSTGFFQSVSEVEDMLVRRLCLFFEVEVGPHFF